MQSTLEGAGDSSSIITKKANTDPTPLKKARTGTPSSPLPTFKVFELFVFEMTLEI